MFEEDQLEASEIRKAVGKVLDFWLALNLLRPVVKGNKAGQMEALHLQVCSTSSVS